MKNISGQWIGVASYGTSYNEWEGKELLFQAEINQDEDFITGEIIETGGFLPNPDKATLNGFYEDNEINFVKQHSRQRYYNEDLQPIINETMPGFEIKYHGVFNENEGTFSGEWEIEPQNIDFGNGAVRLWGQGVWTMKRK